MNTTHPPEHIPWMVFATAAGILALAAVLFNEFLLRFALTSESLSPGKIGEIRYSQLWFLIFALVFAIVAVFVRQSPKAQSFFKRRGRLEGIMVFLSLLVPLATVELIARPFAPRTEQTWIFKRDPDLGWKLRPNSSDIWGGVQVRINGKGVRGPELPYERTEETYRILYLGDSVTFGFGIEGDLQTYPYQVEKVLEERAGLEVETINAGVGGYSPWQEKIYFEKEGVKYKPDLVVIGFYLNDVTEKFKLPQFGGREGSYQLNRSYSSQIDRWLRWSGAWASMKYLNARMRFGNDIQKSALEIEATNIEKLIREPNDPVIQEAWRITLKNMGDLVEAIRATGTELLLISLADKGQVEQPEYGNSPQEILTRFSEEQGVPFLDLLPPMKRVTDGDPDRLEMCYRDYAHPSAFGAKVLAPFISDFILREFDTNSSSITPMEREEEMRDSNAD